ncbi:MAG: MFS transporter, partial [Chloroflexi bacterium]
MDACQPPASHTASRPSWLPPALQVRPFRWYWAAQWPVLIGTWMQIVALGFFVFQLTHSQTAVGIVAAADGVPAVALSLAGGALADRVPRRRILLVTQSVLGLSSGTLAVLALTGRASLASVTAVALVFGAADAVDLPSRQALVADLVERRLVVSAVALGSVAMSTCRIIGPALAGQLLVTAGPGLCFLVLALAYLVPIAVLVGVVPDIPPTRASTAGVRSGLRAGPGGVGGLIAGLLIAGRGRPSTRVRMLGGGGLFYAAGLATLTQSHTLAMALPALVAISFGFLAMNTS